jgi:hypothetical protein
MAERTVDPRDDAIRDEWSQGTVVLAHMCGHLRTSGVPRARGNKKQSAVDSGVLTNLQGGVSRTGSNGDQELGEQEPWREQDSG